MKPREQRRKVFVPARIRCEARWGDVRVLDISANGLKLQATTLPPRGTYIELHRGCQSIVARVVWTGQERFGVRTQDRVAIEAFLDPPSQRDGGTPAKDPEADERRMKQRECERVRERQAQTFVGSRLAARAMEFSWIVGLAACAAVLLFGMLRQAIGEPLAAVSVALAAT